MLIKFLAFASFREILGKERKLDVNEGITVRDLSRSLHEGDELAIFPPVAGDNKNGRPDPLSQHGEHIAQYLSQRGIGQVPHQCGKLFIDEMVLILGGEHRAGDRALQPGPEDLHPEGLPQSLPENCLQSGQSLSGS